MKCLYCQKDITSVRGTRKYCSGACKLKANRLKVSVSKIVPVSVSKDTVSEDSVSSIFTITQEIEKKLELAYKNHEKKWNNRFRGATGNIKVPDIKCVPCYENGKRILTEWEKAQLSVPSIEEVKETDSKELVFTNETTEERIAAYREEYPGVTWVPNWILHGFDSKEEALKEAMKAVIKSVGESNSGL